MQNKNLKKDER